MSPVVSVLMPVYNCGRYLREAIQSILDQTFGDFEFLIINDGSTDDSASIIRSFSDPRIRYFENDGNQGLIYTLNRGLSLAKGRYIARMDGDDISLPERFRRQVEFMEVHPRVGVCGTWFRMFGAENQIFRLVTSDQEIQANLLFHNNVIAHPTVMIRRDLLIAHQLSYDVAHYSVEDFGLWIRCGFYAELANIDEVLVLYRKNDASITAWVFQDSGQWTARHTATLRVYEITLARLGVLFTPSDLALHFGLTHFMGQGLFGRDVFVHTEEWLERLKAANAVSLIYDPCVFQRVLSQRWADFCWHATHLGWWGFYRYFRSQFCCKDVLSLGKMILYGLQCGIWWGWWRYYLKRIYFWVQGI